MTKKNFLLLFICLLSALKISAIVYSGSCGDNVRYSFDSITGVLEITGTGAMKDFTSTAIPWYSKTSNIKSIEISEGVTSIGNYAFDGCHELTSVTLPNSMTRIGQWAFNRCSKLTSIDIPNSVTEIGEWAFAYCSGLTSVTIPNGLTSISKCAFIYCSGLTEVTIPNGVAEIGESAFSSCSGLTSVTIPNGVTSMGFRAFCGCTSLTEVTIPNSMTRIGNNVFESCTSLTEVTIPNGVIGIGEWCFGRCSSLTSVTIPSSVTGMGKSAFESCSSLTEFYCYAVNVPTTGKNFFSSVPLSSATLYVPEASVETYKASAPWSGFGTIKALSQVIPDATKCATPFIAIVGGKLLFRCATEDVKYVCNLGFDTDGNNVTLPSKIKISIYATKDGYEPSDTLTHEIDTRVLLDKIGDINGDGEIGMPDVMYIVNYILNGKFPDEE